MRVWSLSVYWPNAVMVSWKRSAGICAKRVLTAPVSSPRRRGGSALGRGSRSNDTFQSSVTIPLSMGTAMLSNSMARTPKVRMPPMEKVKSWSSGNASITRRVSRRCPCHCSSRAAGVMNEGVDSVDMMHLLMIWSRACLRGVVEPARALPGNRSEITRSHNLSQESRSGLPEVPERALRAAVQAEAVLSGALRTPPAAIQAAVFILRVAVIPTGAGLGRAETGGGEGQEAQADHNEQASHPRSSSGLRFIHSKHRVMLQPKSLFSGSPRS